ncbi:hypothetical protein DH2020_031077 [Rehmannia glutinosa]|uniref:F-box domain-containing protein n=1 Tax=Rehmannia glutinosa TaxID=99300 RepID=A0ABR0VLG9_REHGL
MIIAHNDDLLTEIFLWLPAKSLIRFKLVCKQWFSLISSQYFFNRRTLHHRRYKPEPTLLLGLPETSYYFHLKFRKYGEKLVPYNFSIPLTEQTILSFCNGLFLLQRRNVENPLKHCQIYNPATKQSRKILLNINHRNGTVMGLSLAFDPLKSPHYKIICVRGARRRSPAFWQSWWRCFQIEVYDSETRTWKLSGKTFRAPAGVRFNQGIYWKNGIHWRGIFFDLQDSLIGKHPEIVFPGDTGRDYLYDNYVESYGYLHYIAHMLKRKSVMVFELESDYSQWTLKYRVDLNGDFGISVLSIIRGESEEDSALVLHEPGKVMEYKFEEMSGKEIIDFREEAFYEEHCFQFESNFTFQFIETLAPA